MNTLLRKQHMSSCAEQFLIAAKRLGFKVCLCVSVLVLLFDFSWMCIHANG